MLDVDILGVCRQYRLRHSSLGKNNKIIMKTNAAYARPDFPSEKVRRTFQSCVGFS